MKFAKSVSAALAVAMMVAAPAASAQTMTAAEARAQLQRYCAETAQRTDDAGRAWHASNCSPAAIARYGTPVLAPAAPVAVAFGLAVVALGIWAF